MCGLLNSPFQISVCRLNSILNARLLQCVVKSRLWKIYSVVIIVMWDWNSFIPVLGAPCAPWWFLSAATLEWLFSIQITWVLCIFQGCLINSLSVQAQSQILRLQSPKLWSIIQSSTKELHQSAEEQQKHSASINQWMSPCLLQYYTTKIPVAI